MTMIPQGSNTVCYHRLLLQLSPLNPEAQHDIQSLSGKMGGGDDEKTESLQLSNQAEVRKQRKREVLDKWLFCLDTLLELSYIKKNMNHIMR